MGTAQNLDPEVGGVREQSPDSREQRKRSEPLATAPLAVVDGGKPGDRLPEHLSRGRAFHELAAVFATTFGGEPDSNSLPVLSPLRAECERLAANGGYPTTPRAWIEWNQRFVRLVIDALEVETAPLRSNPSIMMQLGELFRLQEIGSDGLTAGLFINRAVGILILNHFLHQHSDIPQVAEFVGRAEDPEEVIFTEHLRSVAGIPPGEYERLALLEEAQGESIGDWCDNSFQLMGKFILTAKVEHGFNVPPWLEDLAREGDAVLNRGDDFRQRWFHEKITRANDEYNLELPLTESPERYAVEALRKAGMAEGWELGTDAPAWNFVRSGHEILVFPAPQQRPIYLSFFTVLTQLSEIREAFERLSVEMAVSARATTTTPRSE